MALLRACLRQVRLRQGDGAPPPLLKSDSKPVARSVIARPARSGRPGAARSGDELVRAALRMQLALEFPARRD